MTRGEDRGLGVVKRVRGVRERDSRIGLREALTTARDREGIAEAAAEALQAAEGFQTGSAEEYLAHKEVLQLLARNVVESEEAVRRAAAVAEEARRRWALDRQSVRTVELLIERRLEERRQEEARRETRDLDELAAEGWRRHAAPDETTPEVTP